MPSLPLQSKKQKNLNSLLQCEVQFCPHGGKFPKDGQLEELP